MDVFDYVVAAMPPNGPGSDKPVFVVMLWLAWSLLDALGTCGLSLLPTLWLRDSGLHWLFIRRNEKIEIDGGVVRYYNWRGRLAASGVIGSLRFVRVERGVRHPLRYVLQLGRFQFPVYASTARVDALFAAFGLPPPPPQDRVWRAGPFLSDPWN